MITTRKGRENREESDAMPMLLDIRPRVFFANLHTNSEELILFSKIHQAQIFV